MAEETEVENRTEKKGTFAGFGETMDKALSWMASKISSAFKNLAGIKNAQNSASTSGQEKKQESDTPTTPSASKEQTVNQGTDTPKPGLSSKLEKKEGPSTELKNEKGANPSAPGNGKKPGIFESAGNFIDKNKGKIAIGIGVIAGAAVIGAAVIAATIVTGGAALPAIVGAAVVGAAVVVGAAAVGTVAYNAYKGSKEQNKGQAPVVGEKSLSPNLTLEEGKDKNKGRENNPTQSQGFVSQLKAGLNNFASMAKSAVNKFVSVVAGKDVRSAEVTTTTSDSVTPAVNVQSTKVGVSQSPVEQKKNSATRTTPNALLPAAAQSSAKEQNFAIPPPPKRPAPAIPTTMKNKNEEKNSENSINGKNDTKELVVGKERDKNQRLTRSNGVGDLRALREKAVKAAGPLTNEANKAKIGQNGSQLKRQNGSRNLKKVGGVGGP